MCRFDSRGALILRQQIKKKTYPGTPPLKKVGVTKSETEKPIQELKMH